MNRRKFLATSATATLGASVTAPLGAAENGDNREFYELRQYTFDTTDADAAGRKREAVERFFAEAAVPALNRLGLKPIGVFSPADVGSVSLFVLIPHPTMASVVTLKERLAEDSTFVRAGGDYLDATREQPAYKRIESWFLRAFSGMPRLETPVRSGGRVLQLRIYESPTERTGLKKIEMFNEAGEIRIFREVGLRPVFFGETLVGSKMPNLTYMLAFESEEELKANWRKFGQHPDWQKLKAMPEYADKAILSGITNILLKPASCSQI